MRGYCDCSYCPILPDNEKTSVGAPCLHFNLLSVEQVERAVTLLR
jgi:hypothetical protein